MQVSSTQAAPEQKTTMDYEIRLRLKEDTFGHRADANEKLNLIAETLRKGMPYMDVSVVEDLPDSGDFSSANSQAAQHPNKKTNAPFLFVKYLLDQRQRVIHYTLAATLMAGAAYASYRLDIFKYSPEHSISSNAGAINTAANSTPSPAEKKKTQQERESELYLKFEGSWVAADPKGCSQPARLLLGHSWVLRHDTKTSSHGPAGPERVSGLTVVNDDTLKLYWGDNGANYAFLQILERDRFGDAQRLRINDSIESGVKISAPIEYIRCEHGRDFSESQIQAALNAKLNSSNAQASNKLATSPAPPAPIVAPTTTTHPNIPQPLKNLSMDPETAVQTLARCSGVFVTLLAHEKRQDNINAYMAVLRSIGNSVETIKPYAPNSSTQLKQYIEEGSNAVNFAVGSRQFEKVKETVGSCSGLDAAIKRELR